jgi:signal peptidase I
MESVLSEGDCVLVNRLGVPSNPARDRVVVFRSPDGRAGAPHPLLLGRCVGMPGDTVHVTPEGYTVEGRLTRVASEKAFRVRKNIKPALLEALQRLEIPLRSVAEDSLDITIRLTGREETLLRGNLHLTVPIEPAPAEQWSFAFVIPFEGYECGADSVSLRLYGDAIRQEAGDGVQGATGYRFRRNYYWILSDGEEAVDSRHAGFIPRTCVTGNVLLCWYGRHVFERIR